MARPIDFADFIEQESGWSMAARWVLIAGLLAAPLAFGAVLPWSWAALIAVASVALCLWAVAAAIGGGVDVPVNMLYLPVSVVTAWGVVQWLTGHTLDPIGTREALVKAFAYLAIFFLAGALFTSAPERTWRALGLTITVYTFAISVFALVQFFAAPGKLYGIIEPRYGGWVFGPYVNHNHYAGLLELLVCPVFAFGFSQWQPLRTLSWFTTALAFTSILVSGSRAGAACLALGVAGVIAMAVLRLDRMRSKWSMLAATVSIMAVLAFAAYVIPPEVSNRYEQSFKGADASFDQRLSMSRDGWSIVRDHPGAGVGLGAIEVAYPQYESWSSDARIDHIHDDYIELAAETGAIGIGGTIVAIFLFVWLAFGRPRQLDSPIGSLQLGAAIGVCALLLHSAFDFNLHIPANSALFAFMAAIATLSSSAKRLWCEVSPN